MAAPVVASTADAVVDPGVVGTVTGITVNKPSGTVSGDVLYAYVQPYDHTTITITPPSGWTSIVGPTRANGSNVLMGQLYRKVAGASEPTSYTFGVSASRYTDGIIVRVTGADTTTPEDGTATGNSATSGTTRTGNSITTTGSDRLLLLFTGGYNGAPSSTPSGMTQELIQDGANGVYSQSIAAAGATGNKSHTQSASDSWVATMVAVAPPASGASTGAVNATLGAMTSSAAGQLAIAGTVDRTLSAVTLSSAGQLALSASLNATLAATTLTAAGVQDSGITGTLSASLAAVTLSSNGLLALSATLGATLAAVTLSSAAQLAIAGGLTASLQTTTVSAAGTLTAGAQGAVNTNLGAVTASASGQLAIAGGLTASLQATTLAAAGQLAIAGTLSRSLGAVTLNAFGGQERTASVSMTLAAVTLSATGAAVIGAWTPVSGEAGEWSPQAGDSATWSRVTGSLGNWS